MDDQTYTGVDNLEHMATQARNYNAFLVSEVERHVGGCGTLVDLGAGIGTFAGEFVDRGYDVTCVEPDQRLQERLREKGLTCVSCIGELPERSVDACYTLNVLEHIDDDEGVLRDVYARLRPGGVFYVYVPAFPILYSSMDRKVGHVRRYTRASLVSRLERVGLRIRDARYVDSLGFGASLLFKWIGNDDGDLNPRALALYDRLVFPASRALDVVLHPIVGKNLAVTAVRPKDPD